MINQQRRSARRIEAAWFSKQLHDQSICCYLFQLLLYLFILFLWLSVSWGWNYVPLAFVRTILLCYNHGW
jgi:hypothetical protein